MQLSLGERSLQYDLMGRGSEALVLIPSLGTTGKMWAPQVDVFQSEYIVVTYDAGHMRSGLPAGDTALDTYVDELGRLMDAVGLVAAHLVGLSMGGMIAQIAAARWPERVKSLVLASTTPSYPEESRRQLRERASVAEERGMEPLVEPTIERWFTQGFRETRAERVEPIRRMLRSADPRSYASAARAVASVDTLQDLPRIQAPTLVLFGDADASLPAQARGWLSSGIPHARFSEIAAAHLCNVENARSFNDQVARFLADVREMQPDDPGLEAPIAPW